MALQLDIQQRPDLENVRNWRDRLIGDWGSDGNGLDAEQQSEEDLYFGDFEIGSPGGKLGVRTGSAASDADAAIDSLTPSDVLITVRPARARAKYKDQADKLMRFGRALVHAWKRPKNEIRQIVGDQVIRRIGVGRVLYDDTLWSEMPPKIQDLPAADETRIEWEAVHRRKNPIILERRNPRTTRWREHRGEIVVVVEHYQATAFDTYQTLGQFDKAKEVLDGRDPLEPVMIDDVWIGPWRCIMIEEQDVFPGDGVVAHGYPIVPYIVAPFRELPFDEMNYKYRGMLTNSAGLYPIESQVLTMNVWLLAWNAWRTWVGWTKDGREISVIPGQFLQINKQQGEWIEMLEGRPMPPELFTMAQVVDSYIQRNGVAQGPRSVEGTRSGQQVWAIQAMRQLKIESAKESLTLFMERALYLASAILELQIPEGITLPVPGKDKEGNDYGEVTVKPDDINGYWDGYEVNFARRLDPALIEQAKAMMTMAVNNWMPMEVSYELSGLTDNPSEWTDKLILQATDRLPFMLELGAISQVGEFYGEESEEYLTLRQNVLQSRASQGGQPGQAPPGAPGVPSGGGMTPPSMRGPTNPEAAPPALGAALSQGTQTKTSGRPRGSTARAPAWSKPAGAGSPGSMRGS